MYFILTLLGLLIGIGVFLALVDIHTSLKTIANEIRLNAEATARR